MDKQAIIGTSILFAGLPPEQLADVAAIAQEQRFSRGQTVFFAGDPCRGFYMVAEGRVKIFKSSLAGKEQILHIFGPGEPFGEVPVFHGQPYPANAEILDNSTLLFFPRDRFIELINRNPSLALNMLAVLSLRLRRFVKQIEDLSLKEVPARLSGYLLYLMGEQENEKLVRLEISKGQLASLLGTIPETLSRIFAKMAEEGLIQVEGKKIRILDRNGLAERAE